MVDEGLARTGTEESAWHLSAGGVSEAVDGERGLCSVSSVK